MQWKKDTTAAGYQIQLATDKKFKKNVKEVTVGKAKITSQIVKKLKGGKKYYVRIRAYATNGNEIIPGEWSKTKTIKIKK